MRSNRGKRLYVFGAVSLAVFVGLMILTGILYDGFATADRAKAVRDAELKQLDADGAEQAKKKLAAAEAATTATLSQYEKVHQEFTTFLSEHFTELMKESSDAANSASTSTFSIVEETAESAKKVELNPAWEKANQQLTDLRRRRTDLLTNLTETHPLVRQVQLAISDVEAQLKQITAEMPETPKPQEQKPPVAQADATKNWVLVNEQYRALLQEVGAAEKSYHAALKSEKAKRQNFDRLAAAAKVAPMKLVTAGGANPRLAIYLGGLIAIAAGVIVSRYSRIAETTYQSAAEVRQSLGVAVLGVIPRDPHVQPRERPKQESKWVRRAVVAAELSLAATVAVLAVSAVADRQFLFDLIADPLAACSGKFFC